MLFLTSVLNGGELLVSQPAALPQGKNPAHIEYEAGLFPDLVFMIWRREFFCPCWNLNPGLSSR